MEFKTLSGIQPKEVLQTFNLAFSDYFVPLQLSEAQFTSKLIADKTDFSLSVGAFENGALVGFVLHGIDTVNDQRVGYNGGTGVIPKKRGFGLTRQMYGFILPLLKQHDIQRLVLEVITKNSPAITSYKRCGFTTKRKLICYKGEVRGAAINTTVVLQELQNFNWSLMVSFWEVSPTWQNAIGAIETTRDHTISIGAYLGHQLVGYVIYNPTSKRIQQIAVHPDFRQKGIGTALVFEIVQRYGNPISLLNVDNNSESLNAFLKGIGLAPYLEQFEMELKIDVN